MQIYLAGAITGLDWDTAERWRFDIKNRIERRSEWKVINPCDHIPHVKTFTEAIEKGCMMWDLWQLKRSDVVVCDFSHPTSLGTSWELGIAYEKGIPIIGVHTEQKPKDTLHPWWKIAAMHICKDIDELEQYLSKNFLNGD